MAAARGVVVAVVTLLLVEGGLRLVTPADLSFAVWPPLAVTHFHPTAVNLPGVNYERTTFSTNRDGLRGAEAPAGRSLRVLVVGGSTTEQLYLDDADTWSAVLGRALNTSGIPAWVENSGKSGMNTHHHAVLLRTLAPELHPDLVVALVGINDLVLGLRSDLRDIDWHTGMQQYVLARGPLVADGRPQLTGLLAYYWAKRAARTILLGDSGGGLIQDDSGTLYATARAERRAATLLATPPNDLADELAAYVRRLRALTAAAQAAGVPLVLLTQPTLLHQGMTPPEEALLLYGRRGEDPKVYYAPQVMTSLLARYNATLLDVCADEHLSCIDLVGAVPPTAENFFDDVHFTPRGSVLFGELVAASLAPLVAAR